MKPRLAIVTERVPSPDDLLRQMLAERDSAARVLARLDQLIVEEGRARWRARGMWGTPTLGQMRNEVGT